MTYKGHVENGVVVLDEAAALPEGVTVEIKVALAEKQGSLSKEGSHFDRIKDIIGACKDLPPDFAANHDYYIHGADKRI